MAETVRLTATGVPILGADDIIEEQEEHEEEPPLGRRTKPDVGEPEPPTSVKDSVRSPQLRE